MTNNSKAGAKWWSSLPTSWWRLWLVKKTMLALLFAYYDEASRDCIAKTVQLESQLACLASLTTSKQQADLPLKTWRTNRHRPLMAINSPYCLSSKFKLTQIFINIHILFSTSQHNQSVSPESGPTAPALLHYCTDNWPVYIPPSHNASSASEIQEKWDK